MSHYILVVDDDKAMRYALRNHLEGLGYEVSEAVNGLEALKSIAARTPDLMVLDVMMTPVSGWDVLKALYDSPATRGLRVLMLTGLGDPRQEAYGWLLGCDWYQVKEKPLRFDDLGLVVKRLLAVDPDLERAAVQPASGSDEEEGAE